VTETTSTASERLRPSPFEAFGELPERVNIARFLPELAERAPEQIAIHEARGRAWKSITYAQLEARSNAIARALVARGVEPGTRVCVFVRPGVDLIAITYALFKTAAVPVLADPGMGRKRLLAAVHKMKPTVFVGIPLAQLVRRLFPRSFESVRLALTVGAGSSADHLPRLEREHAGDFACVDTRASDEAAILFTSGSTGPPKGVVYTHGMFHAQVLALGAAYDFRAGEVDLACFPLFALFNTAFGMTSVFPRMDASRPSKVDPRAIVAAIRTHAATSTFGSPAIWRRVVPYCIANGITLPTLERVLIAGAPVPPALIADFHRVLPSGGDVATPYGATESLPVASITGHAIVADCLPRMLEGEGTCVGLPAAGIDLRLIRVTDEAIEEWDDALEVAPGEWGEICVRGPVVTHEYKDEPGHTRAAKIKPANGERGVWHRIGDVGYRDAGGRLWFGGRKSHRLLTPHGFRMPVPTENLFNTVPGVARSALVGVGAAPNEGAPQRPVLCVEPERKLGRFSRGAKQLLRALEDFAATVPRGHEVDAFLLHPGFPVDARHNAKIHREQLRDWAQGHLR